jgi:ketosteroid isomerase-like protein
MLTMPDMQLPAADDIALRNLIARYAHYADAGDMDAFANLFTEDGTWTRENSPPATQGGSGLPSETVQGHAALKVMIETAIIKRFKRKFRHQMTDILIEPGNGPDDAKGLCRALITDWREGAGKIAMCGTYTLSFVRSPEGWRFKRVSINILPA